MASDRLICQRRSLRWRGWRRRLSLACCAALLIATTPAPVQAQVAVAASDATAFSIEQLDALLAPIALYPDALLTPALMASTYPLQVVEAARWIGDPANKTLTGDGLTRTMAQKSWDPSVKSLVAFPQVLVMMNGNLEWLQQVGYAMTVEQSLVWNSVQRLRRQAQAAGQCRSTAQQIVSTDGDAIVIAPAQPDMVYVPAYDPTVVYGGWPYPAYPPVYLPPPPDYYTGVALTAGLVFGAGIVITAGLWGWARPNWGGGNVYVNINRYNSINVNRPRINNATWRPAGVATRPGGGGLRPPPGPVGLPARQGGLPANGIGRPNVSVPGTVVRPPGGIGRDDRPPISHGDAARPSGEHSATGSGNRPAAGHGGGRAPPAFSGTGEGRAAAHFGNRGAQSIHAAAPQHAGGGGGARGGGEHRR